MAYNTNAYKQSIADGIKWFLFFLGIGVMFLAIKYGRSLEWRESVPNSSLVSP